MHVTHFANHSRQHLLLTRPVAKGARSRARKRERERERESSRMTLGTCAPSGAALPSGWAKRAERERESTAAL